MKTPLVLLGCMAFGWIAGSIYHDNAQIASGNGHSVYACVNRETGELAGPGDVNLATVMDYDCANVVVPKRVP